MNRNIIIIIVVILIIIIAGTFVYMKKYSPTSPVVSDTSSQSGNTITIQNFSFSPSTLEVNKGDTVIFKNDDSTTHTVTANNKTFDSGRLSPGQEFSEKFDQTGSYEYHCSIHPTMKGTITVK